MTDREIVPTVIPENLDDIKFYMLQVIGIVPIISVDVTDGKYVSPATWPYTREGRRDFEKFLSEEEGFPYWEKIDFSVDMMIHNSPEEVERWIRVGAIRIVIHVESTEKLAECIAKARALDTDVVLALKPSTPNDVLDPYLDDINAVQFMGNDKIGQHGVELDESVLEKVRSFHEEHPNVLLCLDIGVNEDTIPEFSAAGVTRFASGSAIFNSENVEEQIKHFKNL